MKHTEACRIEAYIIRTSDRGGSAMITMAPDTLRGLVPFID